MRALPNHIKPYKTLGPVKGDKIPKALFRRHNTKVGVWGLLEIFSGRVNYVLDDTGDTFQLSAGDTLVIQPQEWHHLVVPEDVCLADLEISVTFHKDINQ